jgi:hypothetical protein
LKAKGKRKKPPVGGIPQGDVSARMRKLRSKGSNLTIEPHKMSARRKRCLNDFKLFCREYLAGMFPLPDSDDQIESKNRIEHAVLSGGRQAEAAPRGDGKTQRAKAGTIFATLNGHRRYMVPMAATGQKAKQLLAEIVQELADNDKLAEDYPEICQPLREAFGKPQRAKHITVNGSPCRLECSTARVVFPTTGLCTDAPKSNDGTVIEAAGILAAIRGMRFTTATGETIRPDMVLIDDCQTKKSAKSPVQVEKILQTIRGDVMKLAGPDKEIAALAMVTVIERNDAADQLLDHKKSPEWRGVRKKMVYGWPKRTDLWKEYASIRRGGVLEGDGGRAGNEYYQARRVEMDAGGLCGWAHRFRRDSGEVSALQCAYNILIDDGEEAFQAECQNEPIERSFTIIELKPEIVMKRTNGLPAGQVPTMDLQRVY